MEIRTFKNYDELSNVAADKIIGCVKEQPEAMLCFATGETPKLTYQKLAEKVNATGVDFSRCFIIGLDEWMGVPPANSGSCHWFLHEYLFTPLDIQESQIHLFNALATDEKKECELMNKLIRKQGIDLMVVGVGMNGHIGFNEPGTSIDSLVHVAELDETTKTVGQKYFVDTVAIGKGITVGLKQIMEAGTLIMLANGIKKAPVVKRAVEDEVSNRFPATFIREHRNGWLMTDSEAASELKK